MVILLHGTMGDAGSMAGLPGQTQHFGHARQHLRRSVSAWMAWHCRQANCPCRRSSRRGFLTMGLLAGTRLCWPDLDHRACTESLLDAWGNDWSLVAEVLYCWLWP